MNRSERNRSVAATADGPMSIVALDQYEPRLLVVDRVARRMLPWMVRVVVALARWAPVRRAVERATERQAAGLWAGMLCRKRYVDDALLDAVRSPDEPITAVIVLGAGLDTRAYRLDGLAGVRVFELDLPGNIERKRARLRRLPGGPPTDVTLVPIDFRTQDIAAALGARGPAAGERVFVIWEAVTQYLEEAAVRSTFGFLAGLATGSRLAFTYVRRDFLEGRSCYGAEVVHRRFVQGRPIWTFGLDPADVAGLLAEYGWSEVEQVGPAEYAQRYLRPEGRTGDATEIERAVLARKT